MKIKVTYEQEEAELLERLLSAISSAIPRLRAKRSARHPPFMHLYLNIKKA